MHRFTFLFNVCILFRITSGTYLFEYLSIPDINENYYILSTNSVLKQIGLTIYFHLFTVQTSSIQIPSSKMNDRASISDRHI